MWKQSRMNDLKESYHIGKETTIKVRMGEKHVKVSSTGQYEVTITSEMPTTNGTAHMRDTRTVKHDDVNTLHQRLILDRSRENLPDVVIWRMWARVMDEDAPDPEPVPVPVEPTMLQPGVDGLPPMGGGGLAGGGGGGGGGKGKGVRTF